jgi:hypothetical protein
MQQLSIAAILFLSVSLRSIAGDPTDKLPNFRGAENFRNTFPQATVTACKNTGELTEVSFTWQGLNIVAFYDKEGKTVATSREIKIENLPLSVQINLQHEYPGFIPQAAIEYSDNDDILSYYVTIAGTKSTLLLHVSTDGSLSVFKRLAGDKRTAKN